ncbi:MAG: FAD-binding protein [Clostridiales bacterium]|nr:FAD-binding protein [Clostridiales bacterium]
MKRNLVFFLSVLCAIVCLTSGMAEGYQAGVYEASANGHNGPILVKTEFSKDAIVSVTVTDHKETPMISDLALTRIPEEITRFQSLAVDSVSGATFTSMAIKNAVADAVAQAGGDASALRKAPVSYERVENLDLNTQILVVGGGMAGLAAAVTAGEKSADVILVEKLDVLGGTLNVAAGYLLTVNAETNNPSINDDLEHVMSFYREQLTDSVRQPDFTFTENLMAQTGKTIDYLTSLGFESVCVDLGNYACSIYNVGYDFAEKLVSKAEEEGVQILTGTKAERVLMENGAVVGVEVSNGQGSFAIYADKIIFATGGANWSADLKEAEPNLKIVDLNEKAGIGSTGEGMRILAEAGAKMSDSLYVKSSQYDFAPAFGWNTSSMPSVSENTPIVDGSNTPAAQRTMLVDSEGLRFTSEARAADTVINKKMIDHGSPAYWTILDAKNAIGIDPAFLNTVAEMSAANNPKIAVYGETIEALAENMGVSPENLRRSFDEYQAACKSGKDEYGKAPEYLIPYAEEGGYYAVYRRPGSWGTIGGAFVDGQQRVVDKDGNAIPNLFAAGEVATAQLFGDYYFGSFSLGLYTTAGRIAAETAATEIQAQ